MCKYFSVEQSAMFKDGTKSAGRRPNMCVPPRTPVMMPVPHTDQPQREDRGPFHWLVHLPTIDGNTVDENNVVAVGAKLGPRMHDDLGACLVGGHSLRVSGARWLVA